VKIKLFYMLSLSILIYGCSKNQSPLSSNHGILDPHYPTILYSLSSQQLQLLQDEFDVLNDYKICTKLNKYGFTADLEYNFPPNPRIKLTENEALQIATSTLIKNKKYTNVADRLDLLTSVYKINSLETDDTKWRIIFGPQQYKECVVQNTLIFVWLHGDGVYGISGFWYPEIYIPIINNVDIDEAKEKIIGEKIIWHGFGGEPHEFIVSDNSIADSVVKSIFPLEKEESIELRVTWKIPIIFGSFIGWHIYLDTMTREIIQITQEFRT